VSLWENTSNPRALGVSLHVLTPRNFSGVVKAKKFPDNIIVTTKGLPDVGQTVEKEKFGILWRVRETGRWG